ncbi:MAG: hypothetical protein HY877_01200 [Deltaproteobacteria bacterium]|nr:hypothetical protein [Deltaproteobacteria bacterium]
MKKNLFPVTFVFCCLSLAMSFTVNSATSVTPIPGVPKGVNKFLDQTDINRLVHKGFKVYTGNVPPTLNGTYLLDKMTVTYDSGGYDGAYPIGHQIETYTYSFSNQHPAGQIDLSYESPDANDKGVGKGSYLSGADNCFTIYMEKKGEENGCHYQGAVVFSGCVVADGLKNVGGSYTMKNKEKTSACAEMMPVNAFRIYKKDGGLARKLKPGENPFGTVEEASESSEESPQD